MAKKKVHAMSCCKCNHTGRCRNCSCVKGGRACQSCLLHHLGNCVNNANTTQVQVMMPLSAQDESAPTTQSLPLPLSSVPDRSSNTYVDEEAPCLLAEQPPSNESHHSIIDTSRPIPPVQPPNFSWGPHQGTEFLTQVNTSYEEVVHWRRNISKIHQALLEKYSS